MILSGKKTEEYRELKSYWTKRLIDINHPEEQKGENKIIPDNIGYDILENGFHPGDVLKSYWADE